MANFTSFYTFFVLIGCLFVGAIYAWLMYGVNKNVQGKLKWVLTSLRTLGVAAIMFLLFSPLVKRIIYTPEKPIIVIATDNSISVKNIKTNDFEANSFNKKLAAFADKLADKYDVKTYTFGDSIKTGLQFSGTEKATDADKLFKQLNNTLLNSNVGAVVLATDGIFNRGGNPLYALQNIQAPIYTIGLGDTTAKRDVVVANVTYNDIAYLANDFVVEVQLEAYRCAKELVQLSVYQDGNKLQEVAVNVSNENFAKTVTFKLKATQKGLRKFSIVAKHLANEITVKNNQQSFFVNVVDGKQKVLIAAASPHPDLAVFKQAIEKHQHYEVNLIIGSQIDDIDPANYGLVLLYQLPALNFGGQKLLAKLQNSQVSTWYIVGAQSDLQRLSQWQKHVNFTGFGQVVKEVGAGFDKNFTLFSLSDDALKQFVWYDPLQVLAHNFTVNSAYKALLQQTRSGQATLPQLFFTDGIGHKNAFLIGEGIWRWKLEEAKHENALPLTDEIVAKTVQYLAAKDDKRRFRAYTNKNVFNDNERVLINAVLYNDAFEPTNSSEVSLTLKDDRGKKYSYVFSKTDNAYMLDVGILKPGAYSYEASTLLGGKRHKAVGAFFTQELGLEYLQTTANHQLLHTMATQTNGKIFMADELDALYKQLIDSESIKTVIHEERKFEDLISFEWLFALILTLLSLEWFLRKRNGEV